MHDAIGVGIGKHFGNFDCDFESLRTAQPGQLCLFEIHTFDEFEYQNIAVFGLQKIVDTADIGVFQFGQEFRFLQESRLGFLVESLLSANGLDRHLAFELFVVAHVDFTHASSSQLIDDSDFADALAQKAHGNAPS